MTINPAKALAADRVLEKHGIPPKQEVDQKPREYMTKDEAQEWIERLKIKRRYRSKIDNQNRQAWKV